MPVSVHVGPQPAPWPAGISQARLLAVPTHGPGLPGQLLFIKYLLYPTQYTGSEEFSLVEAVGCICLGSQASCI